MKKLELRKLIREEIKNLNEYFKSDPDKCYAQIVFQQSDDANEALDILNTQGEKAAINHLNQWDYGEYPRLYHDINNSIGRDDDIYKSKRSDYILTYNSRIGYIGLYIELPEWEYEDYNFED